MISIVRRGAIPFFSALIFSLLLAGQVFAGDLPRTKPGKVGLSAERLGRIEAHLSASVSRGERSGYVAMVARGGRIAYEATTGMRDVENAEPMTMDTRFRIASMTKPITSLAVMMLVEEGKLLLSDPVSRFLPEFTDMRVATSTDFAEDGSIPTRPAERQITILHLITHTSGLGYVLDFESDLGRQFREANIHFGPENLAEMTQALARQPLYFEPGERWQYSFATDVLGRLVEVVSGQSFDSFVEARIFAPLGMDSSDFIIGQSFAAHREDGLAIVYRFDENGAMLPAARTDVSIAGADTSGGEEILRWPSGGAGLISTPHDYMRFLLMMANGGELDGARLLSPTTVERMTRNNLTYEVRAASALADPAAMGFGLGFSVILDAGLHPVAGSDGEFAWGGYFGTNFFVAPGEDNLIGIMLSQRIPGPNDPNIRIRNEFRSMVYGAVVD